MPPTFSYHSYGAGQGVNRMHAFHGLHLRLVAQAAHGHAQAWRMLDGGMEHAVDFQVDGVLRLAGGFVIGIQALDRLADPAELARVAQGNAGRVGHRHIQGGTCQFAVAQGATGSGVHHAAGLGGQLAERYAQLIGAGLHQHRAGEGAEAAHGRVAHAHRHAAAGDAHAIFHHHVGFAGRGRFDDERGRVGIQFFTDDLRHGGVGTLAAFHEGAEQAHAAVWANLQEGGYLGSTLSGRAGRGLHAGGAQRQAEADHQRAHRGAGQEAATGQVDRFAQGNAGNDLGGVHQAVSFPAAKASMAAWIAL